MLEYEDNFVSSPMHLVEMISSKETENEKKLREKIR